MFIEDEFWWCLERVYNSAIYLEGCGRRRNSPIKIIIDEWEAGIGNLPLQGGVLGS